MKSTRQYPVPARLQRGLLADHITVDEADFLVSSGRGDYEQRDWARAIRDSFVDSMVASLMGDDGRVPIGLVTTSDDVDVVVALGRGRDSFTAAGWTSDVPEYGDTIELNREELAFAADSIADGVGLALRAALPIGFTRLSPRPIVAAATDSSLKVVAVVDEADKSAVMELLAIAPGPIVFRRHDGKWQRDNGWLRQLQGLRPPPVVTLAEDVVDSVVAQVDEATTGKPFDPSERVRASGFGNRALEMQVAFMLAGAEPMTAAMPARLQRYWLTGPGAAKIRWGTPGAWRRCHRQLSKYFNAYSAKGACTNLASKLGGHGVATHVGQ